MKIKETRFLYSGDLRSLCIENNWYTHGTSEHYGKLLNKVDEIKNVTKDHIYYIANDIKVHSDTEQEVESIMFDIARICHSCFKLIE
jgi:hypothetical protein